MADPWQSFPLLVSIGDLGHDLIEHIEFSDSTSSTVHEQYDIPDISDAGGSMILISVSVDGPPSTMMGTWIRSGGWRHLCSIHVSKSPRRVSQQRSCSLMTSISHRLSCAILFQPRASRPCWSLHPSPPCSRHLET